MKHNLNAIFTDECQNKIIKNLESSAYQQPGRFLLIPESSKIQEILKFEKTGNDYVISEKLTSNHWFYAERVESMKAYWFKYYKDILITEDEAKKMDEKAMQKHKILGEGNYGGIEIDTVEIHTFYLTKTKYGFKIKDFEFSIIEYTKIEE